MSRHRAAPPPRRPVRPVHRARPRYGRIAVLGSSVAVTAVAMLGGVGVLPSVATSGSNPSDSSVVKDETPVAQLAANPAPQGVQDTATSEAPEPTPSATSTPAPDTSLPAGSGDGRRVVFSETAQRVWLVGENGKVARTYLVSGSAYDNLDPGTYAVYSRSEYATGVDGSGTMRWFVRFTEGDQGGAIGFHDIPIDDGAPVQTVSQLGTPLSHGCVRQKTQDALALWDFAPIGTDVVVV